MILGQPFLFNYYSIFDVRKGRIGFYHTEYTKTMREVSAGAMMCFGLFGLIFGAGIVSCYVKCKRQELEAKVTVRDKKKRNIMKQVWEGALEETLEDSMIEYSSGIN